MGACASADVGEVEGGAAAAAAAAAAEGIEEVGRADADGDGIGGCDAGR